MKTNCIRRKRAFTLTELLIVVIVIGVLSAVTLPKFNRVIENRKVTEAEEMMSAVRTEQERRCTLDQNYTTNFSALSDVIASANTKNYTYSLQSQGISATSTGGDYTLKILSYEDGSYCCSGDGCKKLNKNYPDCATLSFPTSNCAGTEGGITPPGGEPTPVEPVEPEEPECVNGQVTGSQVCNGCGTRTTKKCVGGKWVDSLGTCSKTVAECTPDPECQGTQPADAVKQCECGTVTASYRCDASTNYQWVQGAFPACPAKPDDITETCSDGKTVRTKAYSCVNNVWTAGNWDKECPEEQDCCAANFTGDFAECIKNEYGEKSAQYICASGTAYQCGVAVFGGGSDASICMDTYSSGTQGERCTQCYKDVPEMQSFRTTGFRRYACNGAPRKCSAAGASSGLVWKLSDRSGYFTLKGDCSSVNASAKVNSFCTTSVMPSCRSYGASVGASTTQPQGTSCTLSCSAGGTVYPRGSIVGYTPGRFSNQYTESSCAIGISSGSCWSVCVIPYTYKTLYVTKS